MRAEIAENPSHIPNPPQAIIPHQMTETSKGGASDTQKVVIITGGSSGIGRCTAELFASRGWRVGLIARGGANLHAAVDHIRSAGGVAASAQADVANVLSLEIATASLESELGSFDVWVNCAGNGTYGRFLDIPPDQFSRVTEVTYLGAVNGVRVALQRMLPRDDGRIVNVCSAVAYHGMPLLSSYSGAKHALRGFDQAIRAELSQEGSQVRVTTLFPPAVNTPFFDHAVSHMGRPGRPIPPVYKAEVVAEAIYLSALVGKGELPFSFTTMCFAVCARIAPRLVERAIYRLGYARQLTSCEVAAERYRPTLFAPSSGASAVTGGFGAEARGRSLHLIFLRALSDLTRRARALWPKEAQ